MDDETGRDNEKTPSDAGSGIDAPTPLLPLSMPPLHHDSAEVPLDPPTVRMPQVAATLPAPAGAGPLMPLSMPPSDPTYPGWASAPIGDAPPPSEAWTNWTAGGPAVPPAEPSHRVRRAMVAVVGVAVLAGGLGAGIGAAFSNGNSSNSSSVQPNPFVQTPTPPGSRGANVVSSAVRDVIPAIVDIQTSIASEVGQPVEQAAGTGMIISPSGLVVTNNHVVAQATSIKVAIQGRSGTFDAKVLGVDPPQSSDVALLQISGVSGLPYVHFGDSSTVTVGQPVVAIGNALGLGGTPSVVSGIVSALNRTITASDGSSSTSETLNGLIQTDAPISPGDSGGPLVNSAGDVIGMDTAASSSADGSGATLGFALPINTVKSIVTDIENHDAVNGVILGESPFLGIYEQPTTGFGGFGFSFGNSGTNGNSGTSGSTTVGVTIGGVTSGGPASNAGLQSGDVITSIDGQKTGSWAALEQIVAAQRPGSNVSLSYVDSGGTPHTVTVQLSGIPK